MRCLLSLLTFFCFMRASLGVYSGLDELQLSTLPLEAISKLSSLSAGPVARIMAFSDGLAGSWRGDNTRIDHHQGELAAAFRDQPGQKRDEGRELSTPSFSCQRMNETFNPYFMCSDVVDYDYYLPAGSTLDDLEETVRASVPSAFGLMTGECLSDFKKMMCARVFPPCVDNVVPDDSATYVNGLPYKKPCSSLCETAGVNGTSCAGMLEAVGVTMDPEDTTIYDSTSSVSSGVCNAMSNWAGVQVVGDRVEAYNGTVCTGIIEDVYMFDANLTAGVPGLPDLLPPGEHMKILESTVAVLDFIPRWLQSSCLTDMRKVFCGATFPQPVESEELAPYGFGTVYLGRFSHYSMCTDYLDSCAVALQAFFGGVSALHLDCNGTVPGTLGAVRVFPDSSQVVGLVPIDANTSVALFSEPTFTMAANTYAISSQCPYGFSDRQYTPVEQQPYTLTMLAETPTATECVFQCPTTYIPDAQRRDYVNAHLIVAILSVPMLAWCLFNWGMLYYKERRIAINSECFPALILWLIGYVASSVSMNIADSPTCASKTVWFRLDVLDKAFSGAAGHYCAIRAYADLIVCFTIFYSFANVVTELFQRVVVRKSDNEVKDFKRIFNPSNFFVHHLFPFLGFCLAGAGLEGAEKQAYSGIARVHGHQGSCGFTTGTAGLDFSLLFMPLVLSYFIFVSVFIYTLAYALFISYRAFSMQGEDVFGKLWRTYRSLLCMCFGMGLWASNLIFNFFFGYYPGSSISVFENWANLTEAVLEYYTCIVSGFTSLEHDPSGGAARCSSATIEMMIPTGNGQTTAAIIFFFLIVGHWIPSNNKYSNKALWDATPAPLQDYILATLYHSEKDSKVVPVDDHGEKAQAHDVEMAQVKAKPLPPAPVASDEETKGME